MGRLTWDSDTLTRGLSEAAKNVDNAVADVMKLNAPRVQSYARSNAPWTDQTSNARNGLMARAGRSGSSHYIDLWHTMEYGIWLEVRWSGTYAIIMPTITHFGGTVLADMRGLLERLR